MFSKILVSEIQANQALQIDYVGKDEIDNPIGISVFETIACPPN